MKFKWVKEGEFLKVVCKNLKVDKLQERTLCDTNKYLYRGFVRYTINRNRKRSEKTNK